MHQALYCSAERQQSLCLILVTHCMKYVFPAPRDLLRMHPGNGLKVDISRKLEGAGEGTEDMVLALPVLSHPHIQQPVQAAWPQQSCVQ